MMDHWPDADWNLFAMGAVDDAAQRQMEEHLRLGCRDCSQSYNSAITSMTLLASTVPEVEPSAEIAASLLARITEPQTRKPLASVVAIAPDPVRERKSRVRWSIAVPWAIAAGLALLVLWLGVSLRRNSQALESIRGNQTAAPGILSPPSAAPQEASPQEPTVPGTGAPSAPLVAGGKSSDDARLKAMRDQLVQVQAERDAAIAQLQDGKNLLAQAEAERKTIEAQLADAQEQARQAQVRSVKGASDAEVASLSRELDQANSTIAKLRAATGREDRILAFFRGGPSRQIELKGIDAAAGGAVGTAYYAPDRGLLVLVRNLPQLQDGKCYQLWSIHKSGTAIMSVGLLATDGSGSGYLLADASSDLHQLSGLAITDEPKGGSISARGRKLLFGALN
jgi:hypothetical protein